MNWLGRVTFAVVAVLYGAWFTCVILLCAVALVLWATLREPLFWAVALLLALAWLL